LCYYSIRYRLISDLTTADLSLMHFMLEHVSQLLEIHTKRDTQKSHKTQTYWLKSGCFNIIDSGHITIQIHTDNEWQTDHYGQNSVSYNYPEF